MKHLKYKYLTIAFLALTISSCKKFLEPPSTSFLSPGFKITSVKEAQALVNSCYSNLPTLLQGQPASYGGNTWNLMEFMTGKANSDLGQTGFVNYQTLTYNSTSFYFDTWWQYLYLGIGTCNNALESLNNMTSGVVTDSTKSSMLAQAHALRALYYFYLVRMYGAVPKVTSIPKDLNLKIPRTPAKAIYDSVIIPDLLTAESANLPWQDNTGYVSKGAIEAILADVYLTYAGAAINGGSQYYAESAKHSKAVIDNGGYTLFPNYTDMNNPANKNKGEFILQAQFAAAANGNNPLTALTIPNYSGISKYSDEYGSVFPTDQFIASFPSGDKRVQEKQFFYTTYPSIKDNTPVVFKHHYIYKWFDSTAVRSTAKSDLNFTIYRLADVYLMYAEASNRAEGAPNTNAINYVNAIRARANLAPIVAMSQSDFEHEVWLERYFELCFENKMWFDMIRTRKVHNDVTGNWDDFVGHKTVWNATFTANQLLFPVPKQETDVNPNLLPNNPGY
ncbi:MAG: RagB/SusD family nutrient uptake outer membrane protein [Bacteroidetes bacterium]|nr:RagB/SusD family nutrient uptake outer membrane protein [Bacteroidota bacterium]